MTFNAKGERYEGAARLASFLLWSALDQDESRDPKNTSVFLEGTFRGQGIPKTEFRLLTKSGGVHLKVDELEVNYSSLGKGNKGNVSYSGRFLDASKETDRIGVALIPKDFQRRKSLFPYDVLRDPSLAAAIIFGDYEKDLTEAAKKSGYSMQMNYY